MFSLTASLSLIFEEHNLYRLLAIYFLMACTSN